jgi:hypothetical protein
MSAHLEGEWTMKDTSKLRTYGLQITETQRIAGYEAFAIRVIARAPGADHPINPRHEGENSYDGDTPAKVEGLMLADLTIMAWESSYSDDAYFGQAEYKERYTVAPRDARRMVRTFDVIARQMKKDDHPSEIGDYVMSLARALGLTWFAVDVSPAGNYQMGYDARKWRFEPVTRARDEARTRFAALKKIKAA